MKEMSRAIVFYRDPIHSNIFKKFYHVHHNSPTILLSEAIDRVMLLKFANNPKRKNTFVYIKYEAC